MYEALDEIIEAQKEVEKSVKKVLQQVFKAFLEENPDILAFRWTQYAPYFNDGEPCYFSVHGYEVALSGAMRKKLKIEDDEFDTDDDSEEEDSIGFVDEYYLKGQLEKNFEQLAQRIEALEVFLEELYGADSRVTVTNKGIKVTEFEHE